MRRDLHTRQAFWLGIALCEVADLEASVARRPGIGSEVSEIPQGSVLRPGGDIGRSAVLASLASSSHN